MSLRSTISRRVDATISTPIPICELVENSIVDGPLIDRLFADFRPDVVVHTAASYKDPDDWESDALVNCVGTAIVAKACKTHKVAPADLFPDGAVLRDQAAAVADPARSSDRSSQFQLCHLEDRRRALCAVFRRGLGDFPTGQRDRPTQRLGSAADLFRAPVAGRQCFVTEARRDFCFAGDLAAVVLRAIDGKGEGTYHFSERQGCRHRRAL